jgi:acetyl-CoA acetyltransferase family protein
MGDPVIVAAARTAIGTARKGSLIDVDAFTLAQHSVTEVLKRSGIPADQVDDMQIGESLQGGGDIARYVAVAAGIPNVPGAALNRHCASGLASVQGAAATIKAGMDTVVIAGGTESISTSPQALRRDPVTGDWNPWLSPSHPETPDAPAMDMSLTVGWNTAQKAGISREAMDEWAYHSHVRAVAAIDEGRLADEIVPIEVADGSGGTRVFDTDEHPRRDTTLERLASLKPLHPEIDGFSITAGNASGLNDASAAMVITDDAYARAHGLRPLGKVLAWASVGVDPADTGLAPTKAIPKALARAGMTVSDVDLFEVNEAFASMAVATTRILGIPHEQANVNGSGCSLGHPVACTGSRMVVTMLYELGRRGGGIGVVSMCAGGGMGSAAVLEVSPA